MNDVLRDRLLRKLDSLPDERIYQIFDYIEFLESRYAQRSAHSQNPLQRLAEGMEDTLRAGKVSATAIAGTMNLMGKAVGAINEVAAAGKSVATGLMGTATGGASAPAQTATHPESIPRGGPHELGSQLPPNSGEDTQ